MLLTFFSESGGLWSAGLVLFFAAILCGETAQAQQWMRLGPPGGNVISLAAEADGTAVYLGTADGHVLASTDCGEHWEIRGRAGSRLDGVVQRIVVDEAQKDRLLAAVWYLDPAAGGGVFESTDGGRHWKPMGLTDVAVRALEQSVSDPRIWVAGTRSGVYASGDGAQIWRRISPEDNPELQNLDSVAIDPKNPAVIYAGTYHLPWKTVDGGKTWSLIAAGMIDDSDIMSLRIDSQNPQRIFSSACSGIYRSEDGGASWVKLQGVPYASRRTQQIAQDPTAPGTWYAATTEGLWQTANSGEAWKRIASGESVVNAVLVLRSRQDARLVLGTENHGALSSDDGGATFAASNAGFSHRVLTSAAADRRDPQHLLVRVESAQEQLLETLDGGEHWSRFPAQPTKPIAQVYSSAFAWWISFADGGVARFDAAKAKWVAAVFRDSSASSPIRQKAVQRPGGASRVLPSRTVSPRVWSFVELPQEILLAASDGMWRSKLHESEFRRLREAGLPPDVRFLAADSRQGLLAIAQGQLWAKDAAAPIWRALSGPDRNSGLAWVTECSASTAILRLAGTREGIFKVDVNSSWRLLGGGLPAIPATAAACIGSRLVATMSNGGVYLSGDLGESWQRVDSDQEKSFVAIILTDGAKGFQLASESEGILSWSELRKETGVK